MTSPSDLPGVTVVLTCHSDDRWDSIVAAVHSLTAQTVVPDQVVVSVDHNPALARRLADSHLPVTVIENDGGTRGASANRNRGAELAKTRFIAFLDDDEVADPDWLELLLPALDDETVVGAGGRYVPAWADSEPRWFPDIFGWAVGAHHSAMPEQPARVRNVWAGNMAVRAEVFRAVGGFRTDFGKLGRTSQPEDTDLCIRMASYRGPAGSADGHWMYVPAAVIHHAVPADRATFAFFLRRCYSEGHGKILLGHNLAQVSADALDDESDYIRREVPASMLADLRAGAVLRLLATVAGTAAAGFGAVAAVMSLKLPGRRKPPTLVAPARPHVLMVSARAFPDLGGIESHVDTLAPLIAAAGYRVTIAATDPTGTLPARDVRHGLEVRRFRSFPRGRDYYVSPGLFWHIVRGRYDLIHVQGINNLVPPIAMLASVLARTKFVITFHSGGATTALRSRMRNVQMTILSLLHRRAAQRIAVSDFERAYFTAFGAESAAPIQVIRNGGLARPAGFDEAVVPGLVLSIGRLERYKGHHLAIEALPGLIARRPDVRLRILGSGTYEAELRTLAASLGVADRIEIDSIPPDDRDRMAREIARADVIVLLSEYEAHPIAVMEGLAFGRPVVVRRNSGMTELADAGWVTGVAADPSSDEIVQAIAGCFGSTAAVGHDELPSWDACAAAVAGVYERVLS